MEKVILTIIFVCILMFGFSSTLRNLPGLIFIGLILFFLGWFTVKFFWLILAIFVVNYFIRGSQPKAQKRRHYTYTRTYTQEDFEEFFRQATGGGYQGYSQSRYSRGSQQNPYSYFEDLTQYYSILGIPKNSTKEEVKKAYLKKVKEHHPDRFTMASEEEKKYHEEKLKEINEAYDKIEKSNTV